jgi:CRP/FNR family transcriptional regulator, cyclic AMP receptor protein
VEDILAICQDLPARDFAAGEELVSEGTSSGLIHVLLEGTVGVEIAGVLVKRISDPGSFLGEIAALLGTPHSARVVALTDCRVRAMEADSILERPAVLLAMARLLAARLHAMTGYLVDLRNQYGDEETHLGMMAEVLSELTSVRPVTVSPGSARSDVPDY